MSDFSKTSRLGLPSLSIRGFRGIGRLDIRRLGRVTLLAGRNGVGKTTVLEAAELYAKRGDPPALVSLLQRREEHRHDGDMIGIEHDDPDYETLFHGRLPELDTEFTVGPMQHAEALRITYVLPMDIRAWHQLQSGTEHTEGFIPAGPELRIAFGESENRQPLYGVLLRDGPAAPRRLWPMQSYAETADWPAPAPCVRLGPDVPDSRSMAQHWDQVALTPQQAQAEQALQLACAFELEGVTFIGENGRSGGRRVYVKPGAGARVPLRSLGDGAVRMFAVALAIANASDGLLLIDEAENGIHHTLQRDYWKLILHAARESNVQVLATTHSWDCVAGFAQAAYEDEASEGIAVRLESDESEGSVRAVEYTEPTLKVAADQGIEIR